MSSPALQNSLSSLARTLDREIPSAFNFASRMRESITFFGGARVKEDDPYYRDAMEWGEAITLMNFAGVAGLDSLVRVLDTGAFSKPAGRAALGAVMSCTLGLGGVNATMRALASSSLSGRLFCATTTGAGPGIMEAVPKGVRKTRQLLAELAPDHASSLRRVSVTQGSRIVLEFEQATNGETELLANFDHFLPRRLALTERAAGFVVFPGGYGTLNELFEVMRAKRPLVFHGSEFWKESVDVLFDAWRRRGFVDPALLERYAVVDGPNAGLRHLLETAKDDTPPSPTPEMGRAMASDARRALETLESLPSAVTFIGSRSLRPGDPELRVARAISEHLASQGVPVRIGGDGPLMREVSAGVRKGDPSARIQALLLDEGQLDQGAVAENCDVAAVVHSAPVHKLALYENTDAIVALPGGVGTFDEVFEVACLMQTKKIRERPLILVGREFWEPIIDAFVKTMTSGERALIKREDRDLFQIVDTEQEAMEVLARARAS